MPNFSKRLVFIAYVPVIHRGYVELFKQLGDVDACYVLGPELLGEQDYLRKELRAISPRSAAELIAALGNFEKVSVLDKKLLTELNNDDTSVIMPNEDVAHAIAEKYLRKASVSFLPVFLRWDRQSVAGVDADVVNVPVIEDDKEVELMKLAFEEAARSPDAWRHVGAVVKLGDGKLWQASNQPLTTQNTPWAEGDARSLFKRGEELEMSTFMHAEARLVARAAKEGVSLEGSTIYVTTFPCPPCAMLIASSGIEACFFAEGYTVLDGKRVMEEAGITVKRVAGAFRAAETTVPYPKK